MEPHEINILVVDDTVVYRRIMSKVVEELPGAVLMGTAPNGKLALQKMERARPDLVFLDVEMPEMDGLETLKAIRAAYPEVGVIMVSGANKSSADITMRALNAGALDFVPKPSASSPEEGHRELVQLLTPLVRVFTTRLNLRGGARPAGVPAKADAPLKPVAPDAAIPARPALVPARPKPAVDTEFRAGPRPSRVDVLAIGVSTGGPNALAKVIPRLPENLGVPVLVVQHMPPVFTRSLAESLDKKSALHVCEGVDGDVIAPNRVYIAPGGHHMVVRRKPAEAGGESVFCIGLNDNPPENSCRPSVDVLFRSVAVHFGGAILSSVMTGMGYDGREGVKAMKRRGCICLTQDEASCVVYGMPMAVDEAGLSDESVPLEALADRLASLVRNPGSK
jgi:two-component system, chemotaxis family, protein-glutamate methylesterase/glutaminase